MATTPPMIGGSDPAILRSLETQTPSIARTSPATVNASTGAATSSGGSVSRGLAPQASGDTLTYNQATQSTAGNSVTVTSSTSNNPADVVTIYTSPKAVSVSSVNQTVSTYNVNNYAGNEYTDSDVANYLPTFTGNVGAGNVNVTGTVYTSGISSTGSASLTILNVSTTANLGAVGNIIITGGTAGQILSTNGSGVLSWVSDSTTYSNANVANYLPTFTGNIGAGNINFSGANSSIIGGGNIVISGKDIPFGGSGVSGTVTIRGGIDATSPPSVQERVYINNTYIQGTTIGQSNSSANLNLYSADGMELTTAGGGMRLEVGASLGAGSSMVLLAGSAGEVGNGGFLNIAAGGAAYDPGNVWYGGNINISAGNALDNFGGAVNINSGVGLGNGTSGNINIVSGTKSWIFDPTGNLKLPANTFTVNYANGTQVSLAGTYGDSNAVSLLSAFGSNTIVTTGNVQVGNIIGNGQALTSIAGANVTGTVANANLSQNLVVSDVNNNFSYHVVLSAGSGDKSLHIDADDNLQYNPSSGLLTATRIDATYFVGNLNFANGYLASNLVGSISNLVNGNSNVNIATANGNITLSAVGTANVLVITGTGANITGTANVSGNATVNNLNASGIVKTGVFVTGNIPAAATAGAGARAFVTDATVATFGSAYVGGAANAVPVYSDGTGWFIG